MKDTSISSSFKTISRYSAAFRRIEEYLLHYLSCCSAGLKVLQKLEEGYSFLYFQLVPVCLN